MIVTSIEEHVQTIQFFRGSNSDQNLPHLFTLRNEESKIIVLMSSSVDDLLYGDLLQGAEAMKSVSQQFFNGKQEQDTRFSWKEFRKDEDFEVHVKVKDNTERVRPHTYDTKHDLT